MTLRSLLAVSAVLAGMFELRAQTCAGDKAKLAQLNQQLQADQNKLSSWCGNDSMSTECKQQGPGMTAAIATLQSEIAAAYARQASDCATVHPPPPAPPPLVITDVSPDMPYGAAVSLHNDTGGRVYTLGIDPTNDKVLYAVPTSGVWKSTDGGHSWLQANVGLRNVFNYINRTNQKLAIDASNSQRLLLTTDALDGRTSQQTYGGGLYVSTDGAAHWRHAEAKLGGSGGLCQSSGAQISGVAFVSGQPFVAAPCGLFTNADPQLADGKWTKLPASSSAPASQGAFFAPNSWGNTLFACAAGSTLIYWSTNLGQTWNAPVNLGAGNVCAGLTVAPIANQAAPNTVVAVHAIAQPTPPWDATLVSFPSGQTTSLGFRSAATAGGSGIPAIFAAARNGVQGSGAGVAYDVYAADGWQFFLYAPAKSAQNWKPLLGGNGSSLHVDSYSMAFPKAYNPSGGVCTAYASNDGGVFQNTASAAPQSPCDASAGWAASMHGLHALAGGDLAGVSQTTGMPGPIVYMSTADNDIWAIPLPQGGNLAGPLGDGLGDAGRVYVDPAYPNQVMGTRNGLGFVVANSNGKPPGPTVPVDASFPRGQSTNVTPYVAGKNPPFVPQPSCTGCPSLFSQNASYQRQLTQVKALNGEPVAQPQYFTVENFPNNQADAIVTSSVNPPTLRSWTPVETGNAVNRFANGTVAGLASSGGALKPVIWVTTTGGQVFTGAVVQGHISQWVAASNASIGKAEMIVPNPYNSNYAWVSDVQNSKIWRTIDGGTTWKVDQVLTNIATNYGEFQFGRCDNTLPGFTCALSMMSFSSVNPNIAVAALYTGDVAYTNNFGANWAVLPGVAADVPTTPQAPSTLQNLRAFIFGVWYDDNTARGTPTIYVARYWNKLLRITGNFDGLPFVVQ